ncbi:hypothetical protein PCL1606_32880 [Pseudomonas chlororaphis]|uniref:Uncharacterized protein n=1 Tax=Pseudomonas chlororaphis TaxID=587753 RepID=A0A0D5Y121_9PSED|nr:hypothetical protein PCL1606_32880 [Pseudomonas chlororaphis]
MRQRMEAQDRQCLAAAGGLQNRVGLTEAHRSLILLHRRERGRRLRPR